MTTTAHPSIRSIWLARGLTALLSALAVGSVVFWVLQITAMPQTGSDVRWVGQPPAQAEASRWIRALGQPSVAPAAAAVEIPLTLVAVIAQAGQGGRGGAALIAAAGQKAQTFQVADEVQPGRFLLEVGLRSARLGPSPRGPVTETLELAVPALPSASP